MQLEVAVSCSSPFLYSPIGKIAKSCARTARRAERKHWRGELASPPLGQRENRSHAGWQSRHGWPEWRYGELPL
jgi:hypothetical protein